MLVFTSISKIRVFQWRHNDQGLCEINTKHLQLYFSPTVSDWQLKRHHKVNVNHEPKTHNINP